MDALNVITALPVWCLGGVSTFSVNLVRGLQAAGIRAWVLLTDSDRYDAGPMPAIDMPVAKLPVDRRVGWRLRWPVMIRYLEEHAPCIYLPNYDFSYGCVSPRLSARVGIVGVLHGDGAQYYEQVTRLGEYWDAIVAVSRAIAERTAALDAALVPRLATIPHGIEIPPRLPEKGDDGASLRVVYAGRLTQYEKRALDLPQIALTLAERQIPVELIILGSGEEQQQVLEACVPLLLQGGVKFLGTLSNEHTLKVFEQSDAFILTSEVEGLPISLLEAMSRGCVPVVTDIRSGIPELVQDGLNGFRVPVGDIQVFVERLALLQRDVALRREMASQAYQTICTGGYRMEDMVHSYITLFERVLRDAESGVYRRPKGKILPPPSLQDHASWKNVLLSASVQSLSRAGMYMLRNIRRSRSKQ